MKINEINISPTNNELLKHYGLLTQILLADYITTPIELEMIQNDSDYKCESTVLLNAITFLLNAQNDNGKVMICGDYDCDGITSTTMLIHLLQKLGFRLDENLGYYIPNRITEGYGASKEIVQMALQKGYTHFIFIDNGVKAFEAINRINQSGNQLLIIDHHQKEEEIENVILYHTDDLPAPFQGMCAAGLVYVLAKEMNLLDDFIITLGAIGTIGDVMDLTNQNRVIVKKGLDVLNNNPLPVISSLLKKPKPVYDETLIAFQIVPVFNAVGRLADVGNVNQVIKYLLSNDRATIHSFSRQMIDLNEKRKSLSREMSAQAASLVTHHPFQVIYEKTFHEGLVGIIAGQIARATSKPTLVLTKNGNQIKGSARSNHFDVYGFLSNFIDYFDAFGGHANACALSLPMTQFDKFRSDVNTLMDEVSLDEPSIDAFIVPEKALTVDQYDELMGFSPFGQGFEKAEIMIECQVIREIPLKNIGYKWVIKPVGDITEVVYFGHDFVLMSGIDRFRAVGSLQKGYRSGLSLNASFIEQEIFVKKDLTD